MCLNCKKYYDFFKPHIITAISIPNDIPKPIPLIAKKVLFLIIIEKTTPTNKPIIIPMTRYLERPLSLLLFKSIPPFYKQSLFHIFLLFNNI